jgi:VWFA-related protein
MRSSLIFSALLIVLLGLSNLTGSARADDNGQVKVVTVTIKEKTKDAASELRKDDFLVSEDGHQQEVVSVQSASSETTPLNLAIVIQEGVAQINNELPALKKFITGLPAGSQVMDVYLQGNFVKIAQPFTPDLNQAAANIHIVNSPSLDVSSSPYIDLMDVMKKFNKQTGRNEILLISNGYDALYDEISTAYNPFLQRAIKFAQQENITIFTIYANGPLPCGTHLAQGNLYALSNETGGYAFFNDGGFVSFDAPLTELNNMLNHQYIISYKSNADKAFHKIEVKTDFSNIEIETAKGYTPKS